MTAPKEKVVVGVFDHLPQAEQAILELLQAGLPRDRIDMITRSEGHSGATPRHEWQKEAANGAIAGAATGATLGAVAGALAMILVPGVGTVLGGGLLAVIGAGALGAAGGTYLGPFVALGLSSDEAHYYASEVDEGRTVVLVQSDERATEAQAILTRHGARLWSARAPVGSAV